MVINYHEKQYSGVETESATNRSVAIGQIRAMLSEILQNLIDS